MKLSWIVIATLVPGVGGGNSLAGQEWTVRADIEMTGAVLGTGGFGAIGRVLLARDGTRVAVFEPLVPRVTIWKTDGALVSEVMTTGTVTSNELGAPLGMGADRAGFQIRYRRRFLRFTWNGEVIEAVEAPAEFSPVAVLPNRDILALTELPSNRALLGWTGQQVPAFQSVLRIARSGRGWTQDTVVVLDKHNGALGLRLDDDLRFPAATFARQPFGDFDLMYVDAVASRVGVLRRNLGRGDVELIELTADGDTVWRRRASLPALSLSEEIRSETVERFAQQAMTASRRRNRPLTPEDARLLAEQALYLPEHLVPATALIATTSDEVWILSAEKTTGGPVWYALSRRERDSTPRRVLLPGDFRLMDATPTHLWGVRTDPATDHSHLIGMRLIKPQGLAR